MVDNDKNELEFMSVAAHDHCMAIINSMRDINQQLIDGTIEYSKLQRLCEGLYATRVKFQSYGRD